MIERYYEDAPEQFKTAWLNENNAKGIIIKFIDYKRKVYPTQNDNPNALGWYEHDDKAKKYIKTTDTTVIENKRYFEQISDSEALTYTDQTIENDSFKLKKSLQSGSTIDFMGCISSSLEFKVENDFKYLKDQKLYAELTVTVLEGSQIITGPLGVFKVGTAGHIPEGWNSHIISYRDQILEFGEYNTLFYIRNEESHPVYANEYLERCNNNDHRGLEARIEIPSAEDDTLWKIRVFTGIVEEIKRDKSRDIVRTITAYDFLHRLLDNYDVTDWYVWQYGEEPQADDDGIDTKEIKHPIYDLRNSFWDFIANNGTETSPTGQTIQKKNEGWDQVQTAHLVNDSIWIPKTLNVNPINYDNEILADRIGGNPNFVKGESADIIEGWNVSDLVARNQIIDIGVNTGAAFHYYWSVVTPIGNENPMVQGWYEYINDQYVLSQDSIVVEGKTYYSNGEKLDNYRAYLDECDTVYESTGNPLCGIRAHIDQIPKEEQDKVRETQISAATVIQAICQFNGVFGIVNGYGKFEYIKLDNSNPLEIEEIYQIDVGHSDIEMPKITGVVIFDKTSEEYSSDQIHTDYGDVKNGKKGSALAYYPSDRTKIEGDTANPFTIDDNFLMNSFNHSNAMQMAANLYNQISRLSMRNCDLTIKAMPWLKPGQPISFYTITENTLFPADNLYPSDNLYPMDYEKISTLMMNYEISGTGLLKQKIECKVEELKGDIVSLNEVITDEMFQRTIGTSRLYSSFLQTAEKIETKVVNTDKRISSRITQLANEIDMEINGPNGVLSLIRINEDGILALGKQITAEANRINLIANEQLDINTRLFNLEADEAIIKASKVSFVDLKTGGRTEINGANIITGSISCDRIKLSSITVDSRTYYVKWAKTSITGFDYLSYGLEDVSIVVLDATTPITVTKNDAGLVTDVTLNTHTVDVARFIPSGSTNTPKAYSINNISSIQFLYLGSDPETT